MRKRVSDVLNDSELQRVKRYHCFPTDSIPFSLLFSLFLLSFFHLYRVFKINCERYTTNMRRDDNLFAPKYPKITLYTAHKNQKNHPREPDNHSIKGNEPLINLSNPSHKSPFPKKKKKSPSFPKIPCSSALRPMIAPENSRNPDIRERKGKTRASPVEKKGGEKGEEEFNGRVYARS